jgi:hypothetical protein
VITDGARAVFALRILLLGCASLCFALLGRSVLLDLYHDVFWSGRPPPAEDAGVAHHLVVFLITLFDWVFVSNIFIDSASNYTAMSTEVLRYSPFTDGIEAAYVLCTLAHSLASLVLIWSFIRRHPAVEVRFLGVYGIFGRS